MTTRRSVTAIVALLLASVALVLSGLAPGDSAAATGGVKGVVISSGHSRSPGSRSS